MLNLRPATIYDAPLLYLWRNDPETITASRTGMVSFDEHMAWFIERLYRKDPGIWICEFSNNPIGSVRVDGEEISYSIAREYRAQGLGTRMLTLANSRFGPKTAFCKPWNIASIRAAKAAGHRVELIDD
jgi:RimJ/RimL family protein N-acetyltransferase